MPNSQAPAHGDGHECNLTHFQNTSGLQRSREPSPLTRLESSETLFVVITSTLSVDSERAFGYLTQLCVALRHTLTGQVLQ